MLSLPTRGKPQPRETTQDVAPGVARVRPAVFAALGGVAQRPGALSAYRQSEQPDGERVLPGQSPLPEEREGRSAAVPGTPDAAAFERYLSPLRTVSRDLTARGIPAALVAELLAETVTEFGNQVLESERDARLAFVEQLLLRVPRTPLVPPGGPLTGVFVVTGPPGAGKSVLIAHLCLAAAERGQENVLLVNTERERIGAAAQMEALGKVFGYTVEHAYSSRALRALCTSRVTDQLILVEAVSVGPTGDLPPRLSQTMALPGATTVVCLPATAQADDLHAVLARVRPVGSIVAALCKTTLTGNVLPALGALASHRQTVGMIVPGPNLAEAPTPVDMGDLARAALGVEFPRLKKGRGR